MLKRFAFLVICISWGVLLSGCYSETNDAEPTIEINVSDGESEGDINSDSEPGESSVAGKTIPDDFPSDIPIAEYMLCETITKVRDDYMITFHAKDKSISEIVDWFEAGLTENGWKESGTPSKSETKAILAYDKNGRKCGVSVTGFVLDAAMQKDESTRGITIQTKAQQN